MIEQFKQFLNLHTQLSETEFRAIEDIMSEKKLRKKEHLVKVNEICSEIVFFSEGYFRF